LVAEEEASDLLLFLTDFKGLRSILNYGLL